MHLRNLHRQSQPIHYIIRVITSQNSTFVLNTQRSTHSTRDNIPQAIQHISRELLSSSNSEFS